MDGRLAGASPAANCAARLRDGGGAARSSHKPGPCIVQASGKYCDTLIQEKANIRVLQWVGRFSTKALQKKHEVKDKMKYICV